MSNDHELRVQNFVVSRRLRLADVVDHPKLEFADYERRLSSLQGVLQLVQQAYLGTPQRAIIVLEGWDTAGKGGVVRRLGWSLDPRSFKVSPIAAPDEHERAQHYLQRFWRRLPENGQIVVFDRSWYGRVLVERIEGFASDDEWRRAYREINEFERMLIDSGVRLVKVFLHITADEQLKRFRSRLTDPVKRWKLSYEDFRNRARWSDYETAIEDMMEKTSTKHDLAPRSRQQQAVRTGRGLPHPEGTTGRGSLAGAAPDRSRPAERGEARARTQPGRGRPGARAGRQPTTRQTRRRRRLNAFAAPRRYLVARAGERIASHGAPVRETRKIAAVRDGLSR